MGKIDVNEDVHRQVKLVAVNNTVKIGDLSTALLQLALKEPKILQNAVKIVKGEPLS